MFRPHLFCLMECINWKTATTCMHAHSFMHASHHHTQTTRHAHRKPIIPSIISHFTLAVRSYAFRVICFIPSWGLYGCYHSLACLHCARCDYYCLAKIDFMSTSSVQLQATGWRNLLQWGPIRVHNYFGPPCTAPWAESQSQFSINSTEVGLFSAPSWWWWSLDNVYLCRPKYLNWYAHMTWHRFRFLGESGVCIVCRDVELYHNLA